MQNKGFRMLCERVVLKINFRICTLRTVVSQDIWQCPEKFLVTTEKRCYWYLVGESQRCCWTSCNTQGNPQNPQGTFHSPDVSSGETEKPKPQSCYFWRCSHVCVYLGIAETLLIETLRYLRCEHEQESVNEPLTDHSAHFLGWPTPSRVSKNLCWGWGGERSGRQEFAKMPDK